MKNLVNNTEANNAIVNELTPAEKRKATIAAKKTVQTNEAPQTEVAKAEIKEEAPKEVAPKISKFEKITTEFCSQNNVTKEQLLAYLLRKSVNKKTNLNTLAENLMQESFFNREKMMTEILG